ncbi:MAG: hypothetical protein MUF37_01250 [Methanoregulaceae archaeon]|nr:hypothetical protein [Methanoregulaceae archaeon]
MIIVVILVFLGIMVGIFFAYGLILGQSSDKPQFTLLNNSDNEYRDRISLEEAIMALRSDDFGRMARAGNYTIHYIHGEDIDTSGNAKNWVIAVKNNQSQFYFEYEDQEYRMYPWNEKNISKTLLVDEIILPEDLFVLHKAQVGMMFGDPGIKRREINLENGIYTLTITKDSPVEYFYNAYSGAGISK